MLHSGQQKRTFWLVKTIRIFSVQFKRIFNKSFIPDIGEAFFHQQKQSTLLESSFLLAKTVTDMSINNFLKTAFILVNGNSLCSQWKPSSSIASYIFQEVLHPGQWKQIFQSRRKIIVFFTYKFFPRWWKLLFKLQRSLFEKLLSLLLTIIYFNFSDISANVSSFFLKQKCIP